MYDSELGLRFLVPKHTDQDAFLFLLHFMFSNNRAVTWS